MKWIYNNKKKREKRKNRVREFSGEKRRKRREKGVFIGENRRLFGGGWGERERKRNGQ